DGRHLTEGLDPLGALHPFGTVEQELDELVPAPLLDELLLEDPRVLRISLDRRNGADRFGGGRLLRGYRVQGHAVSSSIRRHACPIERGRISVPRRVAHCPPSLPRPAMRAGDRPGEDTPETGQG